MSKPKKSDPLLTPGQAALLADMSRTAFLKHIGKDIQADEIVGKRTTFRRSTVLAFNRARKENGAKKRGPQSTRV